MTNRKVKSGTIDVKALLAEDGEFLRALARISHAGSIFSGSKTPDGRAPEEE